jgi:hypothetical protein
LSLLPQARHSTGAEEVGAWLAVRAGTVGVDRPFSEPCAGIVMFRFITRRDVPYTNNACEHAL